MVEVKRKPRETTTALIRRFSSRVRRSGILREAKKRRYYQESLGDFEKKKKALKRVKRQPKKSLSKKVFHRHYGYRR